MTYTTAMTVNRPVTPFSQPVVLWMSSVTHPTFSSISTTSVWDEIVRTLEEAEIEGVHIQDRGSLQGYLLEFPDIMEILLDAIRPTKRRLPEAKLVLSVYCDPEIEDRYLVLCVRSKNYGETFMEQLEEAENEFIHRLVGKKGWIQLTTDFEDPEGENDV